MMDFLPSVVDLMECAPKMNVQISLLLLQASVWYFFIPYFAQKVKPFMDSRPYKSQWVKMNLKTFANFGVILGEEEGYEVALTSLSILLQHGLGGALCIPSLMNWGPPALQTTLALHGALCEAGWELQDGFVRAGQLFFGGEKGKKLNPPGMVRLLTFHHAMGLSLVIPLNLFYPDLKLYHEAVFLLQGAALVAMGAQQYGYTLDIQTLGGLRQMRIVCIVAFTTLLYSRVIRYASIAYGLLFHLYEDGAYNMVKGGIFAGSLMAFLNYLFVTDSAVKLVKFIRMAPPTNSEPSPKQVRLLRQRSSELLDSCAGVIGTGITMDKQKFN